MKTLVLFTFCLSAFAGSFKCEKELNHLSEDLFKKFYTETEYANALKKVNRCVAVKCVLNYKEKKQVKDLISKTYGVIFNESVKYHKLGDGIIRASEMERDAYRDDALELKKDETVKLIAKIKNMHATSKVASDVVGGDRDSGKNITPKSKTLSSGKRTEVQSN